MTTIKLTVSGAHAAAQLDGPLTSGMVGLPVVISYDSSWNGLTKTLVCRSSLGKAALDQVYILANIGTQATVAPEVMLAHRHLYLGVEGRTADGTLVVPTIWADCGMIQPGAEGSDTAINEVSQEAQASKEALAQQIVQIQNQGNQNSTNLTAAKKELEAAIQNVHNRLSADIRALEEDMSQMPIPDATPEPDGDDIPRVFLEGTLPTGLDETQAAMTYVSKTSSFSAYLNLSCADDPSLSREKKSFAIRMFSNTGRTAKLNKSFRDWAMPPILTSSGPISPTTATAEILWPPGFGMRSWPAAAITAACLRSFRRVPETVPPTVSR